MTPLNDVEELITGLGFSHFGYSATTKPLGWNHYFSWIENNYHGEMDYLKKHLEIKKDLKNIHSTIRSIISLAHPYRSLTETNEFPFKALKTALYAQDKDYHFWLRAKLETIIQTLKQTHPDDFFMASTDSFPILERDFSYQNRLGWIGKNSCLIHPKEGSLFLLGNIVTSVELAGKDLDPLPDFCGTCTRCIDQCPTSAIHTDRTLDSKKCISYWTIESKTTPPLNLAAKFQGHFFGCDICQTVCPWNQKVFKKSIVVQRQEPSQDELVKELRTILTSSGKQLLKVLIGTPLLRSGHKGLKRNALIVIANLKLKDLKPEVEAYRDHKDLRELAEWCLNEIL
jgi:epoxyqueuosine reductase